MSNRSAAPEPPPACSPAAAISDGGFLAYAFPGATWGRHVACLKAAWAEPLTADEDRAFREVAGDRAPPGRQVKELWYVCGRGAGKDSVASAIATCMALKDYSAHLRPGERATILCLACDRDQAGIIRRYISGYFQHDPVLRAMVDRESDDALELRNDVEIVVATNSFRAVRGRRVVCCILDEVAFFRDDRSATPDTELYAAIVPSLERTPGALMIGISSPYRRSGLLYEQYARFFGKNSDDVLVILGTTRQFNETYSQDRIDQLLARDPERYGAEFLAQWRTDIGEFLDRELVESAIDKGVVARPPRQDIDYLMFVDASGGRGDSFAAAVAHAERDLIIIDAIYESKPPFSATVVVKEVADLARSYRIAAIEGDDYAAGILAGMVAAEGIHYTAAKRDKSELFLEALPLFTSGRARLVDNWRAVHQLVSLERRTYASGRDKVSHPSGDGQHDDVANVVAGALVLVATDAKPTLIKRGALMPAGQPLEPPGGTAQEITAVCVLGETGQFATTYWLKYHVAAPRLYLLDATVEMLSPNSMINAWRVLEGHAHGRMVSNIAPSYIPNVCLYFERRLAEFCNRPPFVMDCDLLQRMVDNPALVAAVALRVIGDGLVTETPTSREAARRIPLDATLRFDATDLVDVKDPLRWSLLLGVARCCRYNWPLTSAPPAKKKRG